MNQSTLDSEQSLAYFRETYPPRKLAPLLAILVALTPLAVDAYLPAIPTIAQALGAAIYLAEISIPIYLLGFGLGQLIGGPLSDNFGRRPICMIGLALFIVCSITITQVSSIESFIGLRFVQAMGGGFATVIASSIVRDIYDGKDIARIFSIVGLIMMVAPLVAPAIGAVFLAFFDWTVIFWFLVIYAVLLSMVVLAKIPETSQLRAVRGKQRSTLTQVLGNYRHIFSHRRAMGYLLAQSFAAGCMFIFLTESAFIYMDHFGLSADAFPYFFGANIISMMSFNRLNIFLLRSKEPAQILRLGLTIQIIGTAVLLISVMILPGSHLYLFLPLMMVVIGVVGIINPNAMSSYINFFPQISGTANAVIGSSLFALGAVLGFITSAFHNGTLLPIAILMMLSCSTALIAEKFLSREKL